MIINNIRHPVISLLSKNDNEAFSKYQITLERFVLCILHDH